MTYDFLKGISLFSGLPDADFQRICGILEELELAEGELLFKEGDPGNKAFVIRHGELEVIKQSMGREVLLAVRKSGDVIGEMSLLEEAPRSATVRARSDSQLVALSKAQFEELLRTSPTATRTLLDTVLNRWRATQSMLRQSEKMAQLGTLSAGIAHELNNPAAAVRSSAGQLQELWPKHEDVRRELDRHSLDEGQLKALHQLEADTRERAKDPLELNALIRSDRESALCEWLEGRGVEDAWELAPSLVDLGLETEELERMVKAFNPEMLPDVLRWAALNFNLHMLLEEIHQGAARISGIVKSLKSYSYLDRGPVQEVDIHQGLNDTLLLLKHKLKDGISVEREFSEDVPRIEAYGGELNQAWTNLIDNAIDALNGSGVITLRTRPLEEGVQVEIEDNGPGIPEEIQSKIFDPFFTTKPPGAGTGLGLDIVYNIVVNQHRGDIQFDTEPGRTTFQIWLPLSVDSKG